jgi:Xaa-Pro aminopeptidase
MPHLENPRFSDRCQRIARAAKTHGVDAFVISNRFNVSYLTGFSGEDSTLIVTPGRSILITDTRFEEQLEEECPGLPLLVRRAGKKMPDAIAQTLKKLGGRSAAFESSTVTVAAFETMKEYAPTVQWKPVAGEVESLRQVKDADEIRQIREAVTMAEKAFAVFRASLRQVDDEKSLHDAMELYVRRAGATKAAFPPIVGVGSRAALPHAVPTSRRVEEAELLLVDWGAQGKFYNSDLTRVLVNRKITPKFAKVYDVVAKAQARAIEAIRPGATGEEVDTAARAHISAMGFGRQFGHSLGHGIGLQVHEGPALAVKSKDILKPGMVVTVEPGIYLRGWGGIRIEDDVLVTKDGCEVLSRVPKELDAIVVDC